MLVHQNFAAFCLFSAVLALPIGDIAQVGSGMTICVAAGGGTDPHCLGDPVPSILDDARPSMRPREFEYQGDGPLVPYRVR